MSFFKVVVRTSVDIRISYSFLESVDIETLFVNIVIIIIAAVDTERYIINITASSNDCIYRFCCPKRIFCTVVTELGLFCCSGVADTVIIFI